MNAHDDDDTRDDHTNDDASTRAVPGPSRKVLILSTAAVIAALAVGTLVGSPVYDGLRRMLSGGHAHAGGASHGGAPQYYTCGMHPWVVLPRPGLCPVCQMKLTPIDPAKFSGDVSINPMTVQNIGVRIEPVTEGPLVKTIRAVGTVDYDETGVRDVNIKINGWIEKLHVDYLGARVTKDQPLFELYSPELYSAQEEYLLAWGNRDKIGAAFVPEAAEAAKQLLESARTKLSYFDITPQQIAALQASGKPAKTMTIRSPHTGVVIAKHANEGMKVDPGMQVFRIADLSKVWVMVTLYEQQLPFVTVGQRAVMTLPYIPGQTFEGKVIYIYPYLDTKTRSVQIRLEFDNSNGVLKPGMYANVELMGTLAETTTLAPRSAVIDTGQRAVAFVSQGEGKFEPRDVVLGPETDDGKVQVLDGLRPGEMVVTSGQFLIDSEAKIRDTLAKMIKGQLATDQVAIARAEEVSQLESLPDAAAAQLVTLLKAYFDIGDALAKDTTDGVAEPARTIAASIDTLLSNPLPEDEHFWHKHDEAAIVRGKALELVDAKALDKARLIYADLSVALTKLTRATGVPPTFDKPVLELRCPMYREGQGGGHWMQPTGDVRNPFFGSQMLRCYDKRVAVPVTGAGHDKPSDAAPAAPAEHNHDTTKAKA
ncbi:MAG: efflux RND transporter periplasmic adaptor subunit [Phycisphaera sp.]|nr:efflux RND transporter periplasmic adaptor subunit [Phycisphaera sp.]